jgi:glycosyltransferase involved in cell wall biosynthesis
VDADERSDAVKILQVSTSDVAGGAERSARNLAEAYRARGHESWLAVGRKVEHDPHTFVIPNDAARNAAVRAIDRVRAVPLLHKIRGAGRVTSTLRLLAEAQRTVDVERGREDFDFPGTRRLLALTPSRPDVVHLHNLHGGYFDLRELPRLSRAVPTILNIRDGWLFSGHCAFPLGCERWKSGCGDCPDLTLFPAVKRDATDFNWARKRAILAESRVHVATPSEWMMARVRESIVAPAAVDMRVIPNGVDTRVFHPGDTMAARDAIGVPRDARVLMVAANGLRFNVWKDYRTLRAALEILGRSGRSLTVLAVGETAPPETLGSVELRFVPFQSDSARLAEYYRAADVYLHAAHVESFGNVLLEARACGTLVVASAVGGIPEQIRDGVTGMLVPPGNPTAFAAAVEQLLRDDALRATLAADGLQQVTTELTLDVQAERFLQWYREILAAEQTRAS